MDLVTIGITILAMTIVVMVYLQCTEMMVKKLEISQICRKYILKMETEGYLTAENKASLLQELKALGMESIELNGSTMQPVTYGDTIVLKIKGNMKVNMLKKEEKIWDDGWGTQQVSLQETRMSTAKN